MAMIELTSGKSVAIDPKKALLVWQVLNGEIEPNQEQEKFCLTVKRVYLNRHKAPESYLEANRLILEKMPSV